MADNIAIKVQNVKKDFHLPRHKSDSVKHSFVKLFEKKDKTIDVHHALKGVSFEVKHGEFFGVVGRNGSGKSTLLKILAQIYQPTSGKVSHKGKLVPFIELGVGFKAELTGRENVYLNGALLGFSKKEIDERYDEIVAFAELEEFMDQKLKNYSSGMKVRLAFAVATNADADILLLDEVLAVGDAAFQRKCFDHFKSLKEQKKTIIFVTHSMGAAREYCDRGVLIEDGIIKVQGDIDKVADEYLKLFNKPGSEHFDEKGRWGDKSLYVKDFNLKASNEEINIKTTIVCGPEGYRDVKFGLQIKDGGGKVIAGLNNLNVEGGKRLHFKPNEKKKLNLRIANIYGNGTFKLKTIINRSSGSVVCDQWDNVAEFSNTKDNVFYPVVVPAKLRVE